MTSYFTVLKKLRLQRSNCLYSLGYKFKPDFFWCTLSSYKEKVCNENEKYEN